MARIVSLLVLLFLIVILGITFFQVIAPFLLQLFLATIAAIMSQPLVRYFAAKWPTHPRVVAGITTGTVLSIVMIPLMIGTIVAALQLFAFAQDVTSDDQWARFFNRIRTEAVAQTETVFERVTRLANQILPPDRRQTPEEVQAQVKAMVRDNLTEIGTRSLNVAGQALGTAAGTTAGIASLAVATAVSMATSLFIFSVALYYFLADGRALLNAAETMIPVPADYQRHMLKEFAGAVRAVVSATFLAALAQGIALTIGLWFFGFSHLALFLVAATLAALIPFVGTSLVWVPCAISLVVAGSWGNAVGLALWSIAVVGTLDNVVRTYALNNETKLHPLLALICVLGGLEVMGLWGVFIGPIVASCLHALIEIFNKELVQLTQERTPAIAAGPTATLSPDSTMPAPVPAAPAPTAGAPPASPA